MYILFFPFSGSKVYDKLCVINFALWRQNIWSSFPILWISISTLFAQVMTDEFLDCVRKKGYDEMINQHTVMYMLLR